MNHTNPPRCDVDPMGLTQPTDEATKPNNHSKGSFRKALEVAADKLKLKEAIKELNKGFWAQSTLAVKTRRDEVCKLAQMVAPRGKFLPLTRDVVEATAAALKVAGLASADQYLGELKLVHVEAGFPLEAWLTRTLTLCKKSLSRERGPVKRAPEVALESLSEDVWKIHERAAVQAAAWAYAWGVCWMLREIELSRVLWAHVSWNRKNKTVRLYIPQSKMDQQGLGTARTLQCCQENPCWKGCAWFLLQTMLEQRGHRAGPGQQAMFPNTKGERPSKAEMVSCWRTAFETEISGHSARRTGAMAYVRKGMGIWDLAYLGRWKLSVVR